MKQKHFLISLAVLATGISVSAQTKDNVKTTFQTSREWKPSIDNRADAVMVYGVGGNPSDKSRKLSFEDRVKSWKERGYIIHFMTGIAWGEYQDYFTGQWDGKWHLDEGQVTQAGDTIWHGHMVPYIVPSENFLSYLKERHVKRVIDAGVDAIFMEEPEFWARAGYSESFKKEWKKYYGFDWRPQHESPENTYLSSKLKYYLYYRALNEVFTFAKEYGKSKGMDVKCYVPTHSLVNYSQWQIVSPEASLASLPCVDGYIAQVWTGTSREPNFFDGRKRERVFETAYLEYGSMESMTAPTGRKMFFLTDPIEDWPRDWADYKKNYQATFTAQLLYPNIADYEVMPWPERIYEGLYRTSANSDKKERIPRFYSTQMQVMINALNRMPLTDNKLTGSEGFSVLMANSLMFQRFPTHNGYEDPQLANFYGQALPLLKRGVPVKTVHIENLGYKEALADTKVLLMTYANMKPLESEAHSHIADWVKKGGILIYCGEDIDPYQTVLGWGNTDGNEYTAGSILINGKYVDTTQEPISVTNYKPDVKKEVKDRTSGDWKNNSDYNVGDTIPYRVTVDIPENIAELKTFILTDTPTHQTYVNGSLGIYSEETCTTNILSGKYTVDTASNGWKIVFTPADLASYAGSKIYIAFNMTLDEGAVVGAGGADRNDNKIKLEYSNKILPDTETETPGTDEITDEIIIYTFKIAVEKVDATNENTKLQGVTFDLYRKLKDTDTSGELNPVKGLTGRFEKVNKSAALTTDDNGKIFVSGLAKGTYYLVETKTKDGYNLLKAPVEVNIVTSYSLTSTTKTETKDGKTTTTTTITNGTPDAGVYTTVVKNRKGFTLPTTGGIGTFVFTFAGIAMMAAAVILLITSKKKKAE